MQKGKVGLNSGIHTSTGIEFQKHAAILLLLNNFPILKEKKFFICIEHHDDVLFCVLNDKESIESIDSYQIKKASDKWTLSKVLYEIIHKILSSGIEIDQDTHEKIDDFKKTLYFATNNTIHLSLKEKLPKGKKTSTVSTIINETNSKINFIELEDLLKKKIIDEIQNIQNDKAILENLTNLAFLYIDIAKTRENQLYQLKGQFSTMFGTDIEDHHAAIDTLIELFRNVETFFNQGNSAKLFDKRKQVSSEQIFECINIITTQQKAYKLWRNEKCNFPLLLEIPVSEHEEFANDFNTSIDLFKDKSQTLHQKILQFVYANRNILNNYYTDEDCVIKLLDEYRKHYSTLLLDRHLKAALFAAYVEMKG